MPSSIDYCDDADAPPAIGLVWAVPGGAVDIGESLVGAAVRETAAGTDITCEVTGIVGIYSDPRHVIHYTSYDEVRQEFSIALTARPVPGEPTPGDETSEVHWVDPSAIGGLQIDRSMRMRITDHLRGDGTPHLGDSVDRHDGQRLRLCRHGGRVRQRIRPAPPRTQARG